MKLHKLKEMAESGGTGAKSSTDADDLNVVELESQMNQLFKLRVNVNDLLPASEMAKLNEIVDGNYGGDPCLC